MYTVQAPCTLSFKLFILQLLEMCLSFVILPPCKHWYWHGFVQDSKRDQPLEMQGCDVVWWEARQKPRPKWLVEDEEEEDHLAADVATAERGGWISRWGRCWALRVSSVIDCWLSTLFLGGKLLLVRRTTIMTLMRLGPQVYKNASWYIKNAYWVLTEMCIVNVSPMNARQMMYITVAQVQEIVVDLHTLQCGNILATCRLEIFTFLIYGRHRCLLQFEFVNNKLNSR